MKKQPKIDEKKLVKAFNVIAPDTLQDWDDLEERKIYLCFALDILRNMGHDLDVDECFEGVGLDPDMD